MYHYYPAFFPSIQPHIKWIMSCPSTAPLQSSNQFTDFFLDEKKSINLVELLSLSLMFSVFLFFLSSDSFPFHSRRKKDGLARQKKKKILLKGFTWLCIRQPLAQFNPIFSQRGEICCLGDFISAKRCRGRKKKQQNGTTTHEPLLKQKWENPIIKRLTANGKHIKIYNGAGNVWEVDDQIRKKFKPPTLSRLLFEL